MKFNYTTMQHEPLPDMLKMISEETSEYKTKIKAPIAIYEILRNMTSEYDTEREHLFLFCLDTKNQIKSMDVISIGTINANIVHPREIFYAAIANRSASIILAHNHPSGDPTPSKEDIAVTEKLMKAGEILGIDVLDHIILGENRYISLKDEGLVR